MAVGSKDNDILIYNVDTVKLESILKGHKAGVCSLAIVYSHNTNTYLLSGGDY